ncbi:hypothetical protein ACR0ST_03060 [Aliidiomarina sp. Khilg15.8]
MRHPRLVLNALLAACLAAVCTGASAAPLSTQILWFTDFDPEKASNLKNDNPTRDINGQTLAFLEPYLQAYKLVPRVTNAARTLSILAQGEDVCTGKSVYTEDRAAYSHYTKLPQVVFPPLRLYMLAAHPLAGEVQQRLADSTNNHLSLHEVLSMDKNLTLGLMRGRSYTPDLDKAIDNDRFSNQLWIRSVPDQSSGLFTMLLNGRVDFTIHTSIASQRFMADAGVDDDLVVIPLTEAGEHLSGYIMCSQSNLGARFIADADNAIEKASQQRAYFDMHMSWVPLAERPFLADIYNTTYGTNFRP